MEVEMPPGCAESTLKRVIVQGGDSLLPRCQSGRQLHCQLLPKQNRGGRMQLALVFIPTPISWKGPSFCPVCPPH